MQESKISPPSWIKDCAFDGDLYIVKMKYNEAVKDHFKERGAYFFDYPASPYRKSWKIAREIIEGDPGFTNTLADIAPGDSTGDGLRRYFNGIKPMPGVILQYMGVYLFRLSNGRAMVRFSGFHPACVASVKYQCNASWDRSVMSWITREKCELSLLEMTLKADLAIPEENYCVMRGVYEVGDNGHLPSTTREFVINIGNYDYPDLPEGKKKKYVETPENAVFEVIEAPPTNISEEKIREFASHFPVKDHQVEAMVFMATKTGAANFGEMGTGKTRTQVLVTQLVSGDAPKLITCPNSVVMDWKEEIQARFPGARVAVKEWDPKADWMIFNPEALAQIPTREHFHSMAVDEAHTIKEAKALRTQNMMAWANTMVCRYVMTGTPILNREEELYTLLRLTRHPLGMIDFQEFRGQYCGSQGSRGKLSAAMRGWFVRHLKGHVLRLPAKHREEVMMPLNGRQAKDYRRLLGDGMAGMHRIRRFLEEEKIKWAVNYVSEMPTDEKAVIFTEYTDTLGMLQEKLTKKGIKCVTVQGKDSHQARHASVVALREDEEVRAYAGTIQTSNAGLNLQRANHGLFMSPAWTAAWMMQAEDREHRLGQEREVFIKVPLFEDTIDEDVMELIGYKAAISSDVLDPDEQEAANREKIGKIIKAAKNR